MPEGSGADDNYCDINSANTSGFDGGVCTEMDIMEANVRGFHSALHTERGDDYDGTCNQKGCVVNFGANDATPSGLQTAHMYGLAAGARIDTRYPFTVTASFDEAGVWATTLSQNGTSVQHFNTSRGEPPRTPR